MQITPEISTSSLLLFGFVLGLRHATEADHLAAVSTIVSERKSLFASSIIGGLWGVGHTISLFLVGIVVIFLKLKISAALEAKLEALVGGMLIILGLNALRKLLQSKKIHLHEHEHGSRPHVHVHLHGNETAEDGHHNFSPRSIIIGMVHGLAGSGALMFLILPLIPSPSLALLYVLIFGVGSIGGMMAMSFLIGLPFHFTANRFDILNKGIRLVAGLFSLGLGCSIVYEKLV
ncbi:MAG: urease accessory protein [Pyrinomonadaceae bacterium]